jgi:hypothetical protein
MNHRCLAAAALAAQLVAALPAAAAGDHLLAAARPDQLLLIDTDKRRVEVTYTVPRAGGSILAVLAAPDGDRAYVLANRGESLAGINLETGEQVFRAEFSTAKERVQAAFGMAIDAAGKELFVFQIPISLAPGGYRAEPVRVAVYDTSSGVGATPVRTLPAPRRTEGLLLSPDGQRLYAFSRDLLVLDPGSGKILDHVSLAARNPPLDPVAAWPGPNSRGMIALPFQGARGFLRLDLDRGDIRLFAPGADARTETEEGHADIIAAAIDPKDPNRLITLGRHLAAHHLAGDASKRAIRLEQPYRSLVIGSDGEELYLGADEGAIAVHDARTLERIATIPMPDAREPAPAPLRLISR